jgi:hypothetical protein
LSQPSATTGATSDEIPRFPWDNYYNMQYGSYGVHNNGFGGIVPGWKAVDFFSDGNTAANHAPNRLLASLSGSISYVCKDDHSVAIKIGNFFYSHLLDNGNLNTGQSFVQGDLLGQLRSGNFNDRCGYASQADNAFHVHWGFPDLGTLEVAGWVLDISTGTWTKAGQTKDVFDWILAEQTYCTGPGLTDTQIILFSGVHYCGTYKILEVGNYPDAASMGFPDNSVSSIKVGAAVKALAYQGVNYLAAEEEFLTSDFDLRDNAIGSDTISSIKVAAISAADPFVHSITRADPNPTNADVLEFTVTFSEIVSFVDASDFVFHTTGSITAPSIIEIFDAGFVHQVRVNTGTGSGTLRLDLVDDDSIKDLDDNPLGGTGVQNGNFSLGETYTIIKDGSPYDINLSNNSINENEPAGTVLGTFSTADFDLNDAHVYSFCGGSDDASFSISGNMLSSSVVFDYETQKTYSICIRTTDTQDKKFDKNLTVEIVNRYDSQTFEDVPLNHWAGFFIQTLYNAGITGGCSASPLNYCPEDEVSRAQMAVFLLKGIHSSTYQPPSVGSSTGFTDVSSSHWAAAWIKQLAAEAITGGCGSGVYCPESTVTRAQMAVFLLKSIHNASFSPPPATGTFADVSADHWAAAWIEQLAKEGITSGCRSSEYCPENPVTRAQMAVFLVKAFKLP